MGDLTSFGKLDGYQACTKYIAGALQLGRFGNFRNLPVGTLPGNHDISRALAKSPVMTAKFAPLLAALDTAGLPALPVTDPIWLPMNAAEVTTSIALLNSCWGCGSKEFIPEDFREPLEEAIDAAIQQGEHEKALRSYYERQLDTPAFSAHSIQSLMTDLEAKGESLLVVAAHHNLLPQRLPRLAPYTDIVNSGALRSLLLELDRPAIYLHGHIHQDPIEILQIPEGFPLVVISAPEASAGFNVVEIVFTRSKIPLSCRVQKWRFDQAGYFRRRTLVTVPLIGQRRRSNDRSLVDLYGKVLAARYIGRTYLIKRSLRALAMTRFSLKRILNCSRRTAG
jgi:hypothetical protein